MVHLQIATLALTLALRGVALPPLRSLHKTPDSKGRGAAAAETLTKSELDGLIKQQMRLHSRVRVAKVNWPDSTPTLELCSRELLPASLITSVLSSG